MGEPAVGQARACAPRGEGAHADASAATRRFPAFARGSGAGVDAAVAIVVGLVIGAVLSVGKEFYATWGFCDFADAGIWLRAAAFAVLAAAGLFAVLRWWAWYQTRGGAHGRRESRAARFVRGLSFGKRFAACSAVAAIAFLPAFLAFFPGNYSSDGPLQVTYFLNGNLVDLHWPAAHTLLLAGVMSFGNAVLGSFDAGVALFCGLQAIASACAIGYMASKLVEWRVPFWAVAALFALTVLNPVVQSYAVTTAKDSLFAVFFALVLVKLVDAVRDPSRWTNPAFLASFTACALGMCLMRKQGLYVLAIAIVLGVVIGRRTWRQRGCAVLVLAVAYALTTGFTMAVEATHLTRADSARELASLPSQQIVRTYMYDYDTLTDEDIAAIGEYYDLEALERGRTSDDPWDDTPIGERFDAETASGYIAPLADPAKDALDADAFSEDLAGYLGMYASLFGGHEDEYVRAFLWNGLGYLYPFSGANNRWVGLSPWNEFGAELGITTPDNQVSDYHDTSLFPAYERWLHAGAWDLFSGVPVLTQWVVPALPFYALLLSALLMARRFGTGDESSVPKRVARSAPCSKTGRSLRDGRLAPRPFRAWAAWLFPFFYWATLFLGPVACLRYTEPLLFALPAIMALPFLTKGDEGKGAERG